MIDYYVSFQNPVRLELYNTLKAPDLMLGKTLFYSILSEDSFDFKL